MSDGASSGGTAGAGTVHRHRPPPLTVCDPRSGAPATYLATESGYRPAGPGGAPASGGPYRRLLAALLALAVAPVGLAAQERRTASAEERRAAGTVALTALPLPAYGSAPGADPATRRTSITATVALRNDGPRAVVLTSGTLAGWRLLRSVPVPPGQDVQLRLDRQLTCPADPTAMRLEPEPATLLLDVRTDAGPRSVAVPLDAVPRGSLRSAARRACGVVPVSEAVDLVSNGAVPRGGGLQVVLDVRNRSLLAGRLVAVTVPEGLRLGLRDSTGRPLELPAPVPPRAALQVQLQLEVRPEGCGALRARGGRRELVRAAVTGPDGESSAVSTEMHAGNQLRRLVTGVCGPAPEGAAALGRRRTPRDGSG